MVTWKAVAFAVFFVMGASITDAQHIANSFEELRVLVRQGDTVSVVNAAGRTITGKIEDLSTTSLMLMVDSQRQDLHESNVQAVLRHQRDSLANGALWGVAIGGGLGLITASVLGDRLYWSTGAWMAINGGIGASVGVAVDALITRAQVIYERRPGLGASLHMSPLVGSAEVGMLLSLTF